jgi:6-phosphogluconolactonase (cycloisomerase 2 family)
MTPAAVSTGSTNPFQITVDSTHHNAYVVNYNSPGSVSQFTIGATGALTLNSSATTGNSPNGITLSPNGANAYVANFTGGTVSQYTVNPDGTLSAMTPASVTAGGGAAMVTINAAGTFAYVPNYTGGTVSVFTIGTGGALSLASTTTLATGSNADSLAIDPTGSYAYVSNEYLDTIQIFAINPDGSLGATSSTSLTAGGNPREITVYADATNGTNYLYVPNSAANQVWQFTIGTGGALTLDNTTSVGTGTAPNDIAIDASGKYAYVADRGAASPWGNTLSQYSISATNGALAPLTTATVASGTQPAWIVTSVGY